MAEETFRVKDRRRDGERQEVTEMQEENEESRGKVSGISQD